MGGRGHFSDSWQVLTMCDRVLPWCLPANSVSSPLPVALPGLRWEGRALLIAEAILIDFCGEIGSGEVERTRVSRNHQVELERSRLLFRGGSVLLISKVDGGEAPKIALEVSVAGEMISVG